MKLITYELLNCDVNKERFILNGIKIDTKQDIKRITHSGSYDAIGYVTGERTIDFTLNDPKDVEMIHKLYEAWINDHTPFEILLYAKNVNTSEWDLVAALEGCVLNKMDHTLKAKDEWKPGLSGMALKFRREKYQFNPEEVNIVSGDADTVNNNSSKPEEEKEGEEDE